MHPPPLRALVRYCALLCAYRLLLVRLQRRVSRGVADARVAHALAAIGLRIVDEARGGGAAVPLQRVQHHLGGEGVDLTAWGAKGGLLSPSTHRQRMPPANGVFCLREVGGERGGVLLLQRLRWHAREPAAAGSSLRRRTRMPSLSSHSMLRKMGPFEEL